MPTLSDSQLPPPKSWDEFEEICADLFSKIWKIDNVVRHGRQGQKQEGIDIYGKKKNGFYVGVQCKGKKRWPPKKLTTKEIDKEIENAKKFQPKIKELTFATTSEDDAEIQKYVRALTEKHKKQGIFSIEVYGWNEIDRRLKSYPELIEKHYSFVNNNVVLEEIRNIPTKTFDLLKHTQFPTKIIDKEIEVQLEKLKKKRWLVSFDSKSDAKYFADKLITGELVNGSNILRSCALGWCARILALTEHSIAVSFYNHALELYETEEVKIARAFILAAENKHSDAISKCMEIGSAASNSAAYSIISKKKSAKDASDWLKKSQLSFHDFDADGKLAILESFFKLEDWGSLTKYSGELVEKDFLEAPVLLYIAAHVKLTEVIPKEYVNIVRIQIPVYANEFPIASDNKAILAVKDAIKFFQNFEKAALKLGLGIDAVIASDYALWLELKNPDTKEDAKVKLNESMRNPEHFLRRINLAFQFGIKIETAVVNKEIERQIALTGGESIDAAYARFILGLYKNDPGEIADYIEQYRKEILKAVQMHSLGLIEVQMLAEAGRIADAEKCLMHLIANGLNSKDETTLRRIISEARGKDPILARIEEFQLDQSLRNLTNLVKSLEQKKNWSLISQYGIILFEKTKTIVDLERAAYAFNKLKKYKELTELLKINQDLREKSNFLKSLWCWTLFRNGELKQCDDQFYEFLKNSDDPDNRSLAVHLTIATGNWDRLSELLVFEWEKKEERTATELLLCAQIAQMISGRRDKEFVNSAIQKAANDPDIFMQAYMISTNGGWEQNSDTAGWLSKAIQLSDENGPIYKIPLEEIIEEQPVWERNSKEVLQKLKSGEIPIFAAAHILNRTFVDLILLPSLYNPNEIDIRRRTPIYAFSGARKPIQRDLNIIGMDVTALLNLAISKKLEYAINSFEKVIIPHSTLHWIWEEMRKAKYHQPSKIKNANEIRQLLDEEILQELVCTTKPNLKLTMNVGEELASLLTEAKNNINADEQTIVVHPYPVHFVGSLTNEIVDLNEYQNHLCSCTAIIEKLKQKGQLTENEAENAKNYFKLHEKRWPNEPKILDGAKLYLSKLTVIYLQQLKIFHKFKAAGFSVYITRLEKDEIKTLLQYETLLSNCREVLDELREIIANGIKNGKIVIGQQAIERGEKNNFYNQLYMDMFKVGDLADAIVIDDRYFNKHGEVNSKTVLRSWDLIASSFLKNYINIDEFIDYQTKMRNAGFVFVPIIKEELKQCLQKIQFDGDEFFENAELKAVKENIHLTQMANALKLPFELNWFYDFVQILKVTIKEQWNKNTPDKTSRLCSSWLMRFYDFRQWINAYGNDVDKKLPLHLYTMHLLLLLHPGESIVDEVKKRYWNWLEEVLLLPLKNKHQFAYQYMLQNLKDVITRELSEIKKKYPNQNVGYFSLVLTEMYPALIKNDLYADIAFIENIGLITNFKIHFFENGIGFSQKKLFQAIHFAYKNKNLQGTLTDEDKQKWRIQITNVPNGIIKLSKGKEYVEIAEFWPLMPDVEQRINFFEVIAKKVNIQKGIRNYWLQYLKLEKFPEMYMHDLNEDIKSSSIIVMKSLKSLFGGPTSLEEIVPTAANYFKRLIGPAPKDEKFEDYLELYLKPHIEQLIQWNPKTGFKLALLFSAHSTIPLLIKIDSVGIKKVIEVFEEIILSRDIMAQMGAIEVGLQKINEWPELEPYLINMIEFLLNEKPEECTFNQYTILSALFILIDTKIFQYKFFKDKPPFWRRLAAITHFSLVKMSSTGFQINQDQLLQHTNFHHSRHFFILTHVDRRLEPFWLPDAAIANQLKSEIVGRIRNAFMLNTEIIQKAQRFKEFIESDLINKYNDVMDDPNSTLPGPLEGSKKSREALPLELSEEIKLKLTATELSFESFKLLENASFNFEIDNLYITMAISALRKVHYFIECENHDALFDFYYRLCTIASLNRNMELADELRIATRVLKNKLMPHEVFYLSLNAAAAYNDLQEWCQFLGDWFTEIAYSKLSKNDAQLLYADVKFLLNSVPELWPTFGAAEAALKSLC